MEQMEGRGRSTSRGARDRAQTAGETRARGQDGRGDVEEARWRNRGGRPGSHL